MRKLIAIAICTGALLVLSMPGAAAQSSMRGLQKRTWIYGPETCVHVWSRRSRETRYAGAPRCRRIPV